MDRDRIERRAREIALEQHDIDSACLRFDALLREAIRYDVAAWSTHDPATGLFTSCTMTGAPKDLEREAELFRHEFREDEPNAYHALIAQERTVAVLSVDTDGQLDRAGRYRELLSHFGVTDELRAVLWADDRPWGSATLYRTDGRFGTSDAAQVEAVAQHAARALKLALLHAAATRPEVVDEPPGIISVRPGGQVGALTAPGSDWLALGGPPLATAATAVAAAVRGNSSWQGASSRLTLPDGRVLTLHAARTTGGDGEVAVIVDAARPAEIAALLVDAYGFTRRQRQVLGLILLGRSLTQIASELGISEHTVNDHRKAIYQRAGVSSRAELAALLQSDHYDPRTHAGVTPSPYGGFLDPRGGAPTPR